MNINKKRQADSSHRSGKKLKGESFIGQLDKEYYEYFSRIAKVLKGDISEEEIAILAANTMKQTEGIELDVCRHSVGAMVLERIIPYSTWKELKRITDALNSCNDKFTCESRVEEALMKDAARRIRAAQNEEIEECLNYLKFKAEELLDTFHTGILDSNTNFAARTVLSVSSGYDAKGESKEIISKSIVKQFKQKIMSWPDLSDNYHDTLVSGFLQILLHSLKLVSKNSCNKFSKFLLRNTFLKEENTQTDGAILENFEKVSWTKLLEALIDVASPKLQTRIYQNLFSNYIEKIILSKIGHFSLCKMIKACTDKILFDSIFESLNDRFNEILSANKLNILLSLSEACANTGEKQGDFIKSLIGALGCSGPNKEKYIMMSVLSMKHSNEVQLEEVNVNFHGSLMMQNIFKFKKPQKFVEAFLSLNISVLKRILSDQKGNHITEAFMTSSSVGTKSKDRLLNTLKGHYSDLASDKFGSRSFDAIWAYANMKTRSLILSEMTRQVMKTNFGSIIAYKVGLEMYIRDKAAWEKAYSSAGNKTSSIFHDVTKKI